jgi:hypothetical protein
LGQLRHGDQTGQISQVGAFVIELDQSVVLRIVSAAKRGERLIVTKSWYS